MMYILKFHERDELCQMKISNKLSALKKTAREEIDGKLTFLPAGSEVVYYIYCKKNEIGVIGEIEEV